jgi:hypothetical protein
MEYGVADEFALRNGVTGSFACVAGSGRWPATHFASPLIGNRQLLRMLR